MRQAFYVFKGFEKKKKINSVVFLKVKLLTENPLVG